ncbi:MAG: TIGR02147 family protein [Bacteriovorax sp.]|nr:TIGR02147 family protein [Bacteriovorax sp.]
MNENLADIEMHRKLRQHLELEFERRCEVNSRYSLRAFARSLDVDSSYLSKFLNNKRILSAKGLNTFAEKLNFPIELKLKSPKSKSAKPKFTSINVDQFKLIADWYHYAILELTLTQDFKPDIRWVASTLNISHGEALGAIERLKRLGLLTITEEGRWVCAHNNTTTVHPGTNVALKHMQREILKQAHDALEEVSIEERDQSSITMAIDKLRITEAKNMIKRFRRELMEYLEGGESKDAVFQLSISLFPISHRKKGSTTNA